MIPRGVLLSARLVSGLSYSWWYIELRINNMQAVLAIKEIYDKFVDNESRRIFKHLLLRYLDGDFIHI